MDNTHRWDLDFRPDGTRGVCPRCGEHFETENRKGGLRSGMDEHYKNCHPKRVLEATAYMNKIEKEIQDEISPKKYGESHSDGRI